MERWNLDQLPTPLQVVVGSLGRLDQLGRGKHEKQLSKLLLRLVQLTQQNKLPLQLLQLPLSK